MRTRSLTEITPAEHDALCALLVDTVAAGAAVGFLRPMTRDKASAYWCSTAESLARDERIVIVAEDARGIVGTVQIVFATAENQPHRGELVKLLVATSARRQGVGALLLDAAERGALARGRTVLTLDTDTDEAHRLYARQGWQRCGEIADHYVAHDGALAATVLYVKRLR